MPYRLLLTPEEVRKREKAREAAQDARLLDALSRAPVDVGNEPERRWKFLHPGGAKWLR